MRRALTLARRGITSPNPMVGAVIVKDGEIVGEGYHQRAGEAHAEVVALQKAGKLAKGAALFVTLEPCCHYGRTPPCTKAIIAAGISSVTAAMVDPNPKVEGKGIKELQSAGIKTAVGLLEDQAQKLNEIYVKFITTGLPFVTLKLAMTLDGKIATRTGDSKWISSEKSRRMVHQLRRRSDAVLIGVGTVIADDPELTGRIGNHAAYPARIIMDSRARMPLQSKILSQPGGRTIIAVTNRAPNENLKRLEQAGACIIVIEEENGQVSPKALLSTLGGMNITSVLIEGGSHIAASFLSAGVTDKVMFFIAPKIAGGESARTAVGGLGIAAMGDALELKDMTVRRIGRDILVEAYPCSQD